MSTHDHKVCSCWSNKNWSIREHFYSSLPYPRVFHILYAFNPLYRINTHSSNIPASKLVANIFYGLFTHSTVLYEYELCEIMRHFTIMFIVWIGRRASSLITIINMLPTLVVGTYVYNTTGAVWAVGTVINNIILLPQHENIFFEIRAWCRHDWRL